MSKNKKYELIWSFILIIGGIIVSILGYIFFPMVILFLVIGMVLLMFGIINLTKSVK